MQKKQSYFIRLGCVNSSLLWKSQGSFGAVVMLLDMRKVLDNLDKTY